MTQAYIFMKSEVGTTPIDYFSYRAESLEEAQEQFVKEHGQLPTNSMVPVTK